MKTMKIVLAASLAAVTLLSACTKEPTPGATDQTPASPATEGTRTIAVSFGNATKTAFTTTEDGISPYFVAGDKIVLCSDIENPTEENTQTCTVFIDEKTKAALITTKLSGALTAFYPAKYVDTGEKLGFCIHAEQSGKFEDANFVATTIADGASSATFENVFALFRISFPNGIKKLTVKSLCEIGSDGQRSGSRKSINDEGKTDQELCSVVVGDGTTDIESPCYVALSPGVNLSDLSFEAASNEEGTTGFIKGIPTSVLQNQAKTLNKEYDEYNVVASGTAYTIDDSNWHGYVEIGGRKWATMNVGAESPADDGYYLAWGATEVAYDSFDGTNFVFKTNKPESYRSDYVWTPASGFDNKNTPFADATGKPTTKYNSTDKKSVLDLCDDAAYINWGGAWRMPTSAEADASILSNSDVHVEYVVEPNEGFKASDGTIELFFPYVKYGTGLGLDYMYCGGNWCSNSDKGSQIRFISMSISSKSMSQISYNYRDFGRPIRAIIDDPDYVATEN